MILKYFKKKKQQHIDFIDLFKKNVIFVNIKRLPLFYGISINKKNFKILKKMEFIRDASVFLDEYYVCDCIYNDICVPVFIKKSLKDNEFCVCSFIEDKYKFLNETELLIKEIIE